MILNRDFKSISCRRQSQKFHKEKNKPINNNRFHNAMKKSFMILAVLAMSALAMVSCKKDKDTDNGEKITIYATMDSPKAGGERTHLGPTTNNFTPTYWSTYEEVAVFSGSQMKEFELTGGADTPDATFAGEAPTTNSAYCAFYPYSGPNNLSATQSGSGSTYTVTYALPYCQTYRAPINGNPTFDDRDCPMIAYSTDGQNYQFKNMMGVLKLDLKGTGVVDHIVLTDNNTNAKLHGTATVSVSAQGATPSLTSASFTDGRNDLKLTCGDGVELNKNTATSFYFVVPVGTLGTNGFIIDVYNANDEKYTIDKSNISGNIIQRAIISTLAVDNVEVPEAAPAGALSGKFSVGPNTNDQVYFAKGNMYWDGSSFNLENTQYDLTESWNTNHVAHFYWSNTDSKTYAKNYSDSDAATSDVFFTNAPTDQTKPNSSFTVNGETGVWRTLSNSELDYLMNSRAGKRFALCYYDDGSFVVTQEFIDDFYQEMEGMSEDMIQMMLQTEINSHYKYGVLLFPDNWNEWPSGAGDEPENYNQIVYVDYDYFNNAKAYTAAQLDVLASKGCVFLVAGGYRDSGTIRLSEIDYWTSTPRTDAASYARSLFINKSNFMIGAQSGRDAGYSVRLVRNAN